MKYGRLDSFPPSKFLIILQLSRWFNVIIVLTCAQIGEILAKKAVSLVDGHVLAKNLLFPPLANIESVNNLDKHGIVIIIFQAKAKK